MLQNSSDERALVSGLKPILKPGILKTLPTKIFHWGLWSNILSNFRKNIKENLKNQRFLINIAHLGPTWASFENWLTPSWSTKATESWYSVTRKLGKIVMGNAIY